MHHHAPSADSRPPAAASTHTFADDAERLESFRRAIDDIARRVRARVGAEDVAYIERVDRFSRWSRRVGRLLIFASVEPVGFTAGVLALWLYKQLQATEIGHTALHGAYDRFPDAERFHSDRFRWDTPVDEEAWRHAHNLKHHGYANIVGKDHDVHHGYMRVTDQVRHRWYHRVQVVSFASTLLSTGVAAGFLHAGLVDVYTRRPESELALIADRSWSSIAAAHWRALRKIAPYHARTYVAIPALAGPLFAKVWLGNFLAEKLRDVYTGLTIFSSHIGDDLADYPPGTRASGRGEWYAMQAAATRNFEVPHRLSQLCGGLDYQIEHHLMPKLPPNRLREIAPEVRAACESHGVPYHSEPWPRVIAKVFRRIAALSRPDRRAG